MFVWVIVQMQLKWKTSDCGWNAFFLLNSLLAKCLDFLILSAQFPKIQYHIVDLYVFTVHNGCWSI